MHDPHSSPDPPGKGWLARTTRSIGVNVRRWLGAQAVSPPELSPRWRQLPRIERAYEIIRFAVLRFEHWVSPGGTLRGFLRLCIQIALFVGIPAAILGPPLVLFLQQAVALAALMADFARQLVQLSFGLVAATVGFVLLGGIWRALLRRK